MLVSMLLHVMNCRDGFVLCLRCGVLAFARGASRVTCVWLASSWVEACVALLAGCCVYTEARVYDGVGVASVTGNCVHRFYFEVRRHGGESVLLSAGGLQCELRSLQGSTLIRLREKGLTTLSFSSRTPQNTKRKAQRAMMFPSIAKFFPDSNARKAEAPYNSEAGQCRCL